VAKIALAAICAFTLLAVAFLSLSLGLLRPPRANYQQWAFVASVIVAQGSMTLFALWTDRHKGLRYLTAAGGVALAGLGASWVYRILSGPHFEGYALVLGSAMVLQGALTTVLPFPPFQSLPPENR
jgi:hypothetical protein